MREPAYSCYYVLQKFIDFYLHNDGIFIIRKHSTKSHIIVTSDFKINWVPDGYGIRVSPLIVDALPIFTAMSRNETQGMLNKYIKEHPEILI